LLLLECPFSDFASLLERQFIACQLLRNMRVHEDDSSSGAPNSMEHGDKAIEQRVEHVPAHGTHDEKNRLGHAGESALHQNVSILKLTN
jgi:hypothetical protein